jgi:hypothetical protein
MIRTTRIRCNFRQTLALFLCRGRKGTGVSQFRGFNWQEESRCFWCWRGELNPHAVFTAPDFESGASASSATPARSKAGIIISLETRLSVAQTATG